MTEIDIDSKEFDQQLDKMTEEHEEAVREIRIDVLDKVSREPDAWRNHRLQTFFFEELEIARENSSCICCYAALMLVLYLASSKYSYTAWLDVYFVLPLCVLFDYFLKRYDTTVSKVVRRIENNPFKFEKNLAPSILLETIFSVCAIEILVRLGALWFLVSINICAIVCIVAHIGSHEYFSEIEQVKLKKLKFEF